MDTSINYNKTVAIDRTNEYISLTEQECKDISSLKDNPGFIALVKHFNKFESDLVTTLLKGARNSSEISITQQITSSSIGLAMLERVSILPDKIKEYLLSLKDGRK